jgi:Sec-independent protein translocase protein TatA
MSKGVAWVIVVVVVLIIVAPLMLANLTETFGENVGSIIGEWTDGD